MTTKTKRENPFYYQGENPTVDLIVMSPDQSVLMIRRSQKSEACPGMLAFPGGFIDSQALQGEEWKRGPETPEAAALRELAEETNLLLDQETKLISVGTYVGNKRDPRDNEISWSKTHAFMYLIPEDKFHEQKENIIGMDDAEEAMWVKLEKLLKMPLAFDHNQILEDALKLLPGLF